jgi:hypothetical protein
MSIKRHIPLLDETLTPWRAQIGADYDAYRNHLYRVVNFCCALAEPDDHGLSKIAIAACFHDLGIWTHGNLDYLPPSAELARGWLRAHGHADWADEIVAMIDLHHRFRPWTAPGGELVDAFRKADLVDVSLGMVRFGLPRSLVAEVRAAFPNAGFHKRLVQLTLRQLRSDPLRPLPMMKW